MANTQRTIRVRFDGDAKGLSRAARKAERDVNRFSTKASKTVRLTQRGLASMIGTAVTAAPALLAAGAAVVAFGGAAVPTIAKVISSQQDMGANWGSLTAQQRDTAKNLTGLIEQYKTLNKQVEPDALKVFNNTLALGSTLLAQLTPLARVGGDELVKMSARLNAEFGNAEWTSFFADLAATAPQSLAVVTDVLVSTLGAVRDVTGALQPLSNTALGAVGGIASFVGTLASANPQLTQMAAAALLLRAPLIAAQNAAKTAANSFLSLESNSARAAAGLRLLGKAAAVVGLVLLIQRFADAEQAANRFADTVQAGSSSTQAQIAALTKEHQKQTAIFKSEPSLFNTIYPTAEGKRAADAAEALGKRIKELESIRRAEAAAARLEADVTGTIADAMKVAGDQAKTMETRLKAVKAALDAVFNPSIDVWNATTQLKRGYDAMIDALKKAHGNFKGNTAASQELRDAFAQQLTGVSELYSATLRQTGSLGKAKDAAAAQLPVLEAMAGKNKGAQRQVAALAQSLGLSANRAALNKRQFLASARQMGLNAAQARRLWEAYRQLPASVRTRLEADKRDAESKLRSVKRQLQDPNLTKTRRAKLEARKEQLENAVKRAKKRLAEIDGITATATIRGVWVGPSAESIRNKMSGRFNAASGGYIRGPGTGTSDSVPINASNGEYMIKAARVRQLGVRFLDALNAGKARPTDGRYASGGLVTSAAAGGSAGPLLIEGTLDLGNGLRGYVKGIVREDKRNTMRRARAGTGVNA